MSVLEKINRPVMAMVLAVGMIAGVASAMDSCNSCAVQPVCDVCAGNPSLAPLARTNLPGFYSNDYDYSVSARTPIGIDYYVPKLSGVVEDSVMPLMNPVDRYYATHRVINGQVVDESREYALAMRIPRYINADGTQGPLAVDAETYDINDMASR